MTRVYGLDSNGLPTIPGDPADPESPRSQVNRVFIDPTREIHVPFRHRLCLVAPGMVDSYEFTCLAFPFQKGLDKPDNKAYNSNELIS